MGKSEYEIGYINGYYAAMKGVELIAGMRDTTVEEIKQASRDMLDDMEATGDTQYIRGQIDEFIELASEADKRGEADAFLDAVDAYLTAKGVK